MLHSVFRLLFVVSTILATSGCTLFPAESEKAARAAGTLVRSYCENTTPEIRDALRARVNEVAAPHSVSVTCAAPAVPSPPISPVPSGAAETSI